MRYCVDEKLIDLQALQNRLQNTDLIPSQEPLLDNISNNMSALKKAGLQSLADLRAAVKKPELLAALSGKSGVDTSYLQLLRRAVNGFFPKPRSLREIDWLGDACISALNKVGIKNTKQMIEAAGEEASALSKRLGIRQNELLEIISISDLCRIQWVSPSFARVLFAAGFSDARTVAAANPKILVEKIAQANENGKFYKGKVGLRDVKRLVAASAYVP